MHVFHIFSLLRMREPFFEHTTFLVNGGRSLTLSAKRLWSSSVCGGYVLILGFLPFRRNQLSHILLHFCSENIFGSTRNNTLAAYEKVMEEISTKKIFTSMTVLKMKWWSQGVQLRVSAWPLWRWNQHLPLKGRNQRLRDDHQVCTAISRQFKCACWFVKGIKIR